MSTAVGAPVRFALLRPLASRDFRLFFGGFTLSLLAGQLSYVGIAWLTLQLTGSPLATGGVLAAQAIPQGVLGLLGGAVSDRLGARRIGVLSSIVRVLAMGTLAGLALNRTVSMLEIYLLGIVLGTASAFYQPSRASLLPQTVPDAQLEAANALEQSSQALGSLLGPALAGLLVARAGAGYALAADAVLFVGVMLTTAALRVGARRGDADAPTTLFGDVAAGLRYAFGDPVLRSLIILASAITLALNGPIDVGVAALARFHLGGAAAFGIVLAAFGAGSLAGSVLGGMLPPGRMLRRVMAVGVVFAIGMPLLGVAPNVLVAAALALGMGATAGVVSVGASSWLMRRTEKSMLGRLMSVLTVSSVGLSPLSLAAAGALAQVSVPLVFLASGATVLAAVAVGFTSRTVREAE